MDKVLVVDDTKNIRNLLTTCLEIEGYEVLTANSGKQAMDFLQNIKFSLVFLDIKLPELIGTEVLRQMRGMGIKTPVIIMTAFATVRNAIECTKLGAVAYLQKPFTAEKVRHVLYEIKEAIKEDLPDIDFVLSNSQELIARHQYEEAFTQLNQALKMNPGNGKIYSLLAQFYRAQGNKRESELFDRIAEQYDK